MAIVAAFVVAGLAMVYEVNYASMKQSLCNDLNGDYRSGNAFNDERCYVDFNSELRECVWINDRWVCKRGVAI